VFMTNSSSEAFLRLISIMDDLREKCPWDRKQTIQTLRHMTIEETYELAEAITAENWADIKEELGDLLLHIIFYAKIGSEQNKFSLEDVINGICEKLITRHPHIYGNVEVKNEEDVKRNWEKLKLKEGKKSILSGVPRSLPATVKAMRLQEKARQVGFEWENKEQVWEKVEEEMQELRSAINNLLPVNTGTANGEEAEAQSPAGHEAGLQKKVEEEFGDVVFSLINYARFLQIDAEHALEITNKKFISRFNRMEEEAFRDNKNLNEMTLDEMDAIWNRIKHQAPGF
jgi:MazG family protein